MATNPVDFLSGLGGLENLPNPLAAAMQQQFAQAKLGQVGAETEALRAETQQRAQKAARDREFQVALAQLGDDPTPQAIGALITRFPEFGENINRGWQVRDKAERDTDFQQMANVYAAANSGKFDVATQIMEQRVKADEAAGQDDPQDRAILAALKSGDPAEQKRALAIIGATVAGISGPDKFAATYGAITEGKGGYTLAPGSRRYDAEGNLVAEAPFAPQYRTVGDGQSLVEIPGTAAGSTVPPGSAPRGIRNNNPGNIIDGPFARSLPGYKGSDGRFAIFDSPDAGNAAIDRNLKSYLSKGYDTPAKIAARWAPAGDGANNPTAYGNSIAQALGIGPNDKVTPAMIPGVRQAITLVENGPTSASNGPVQGGGARVIAQGAAKIKEKAAPAGFRWTANGALEPIPGGPADPTRQGRGKLTEQQAKDGFSARRMANASRTLNGLEDQGFNANQAGLGSSVTKWTGGFINNEKSRRYQAAKGEWADALIRLTTGAAATKDEIDNVDTTYFPQIGDSAAVVAQKREARADAMAGAVDRAGPGNSAPRRVRSVQEARALPPGTVFITPDGRRKVR